jgi:MOSC domain-containing protein YiiM/ferredoxin-NADP reductase
MAPVPPPDLVITFTAPTIIQLRTSKMQKMHNLSIETGIYKTPQSQRLWCSLTGLEDDEHDLTFHGGVDKAVHQYFPGHYERWREEVPDGSGFEVGGFGENIVASGGMCEWNVCIGDVFELRGNGDGEGPILQVSLPRQPCFKLNHRFSVKGFAPQTWKKSRTGWYYRVLREGWMRVGDEMVLLERPHPKWTIERIQEYLHRDTKNLSKLEELSLIGEFGTECKDAFKRLIDNAKAGEKEKEPEIWREFELVEKRIQTPRISSFMLQAVGKDTEGEELDPGCFARLKLPNGLIRPYSIVDGNTNRFQLGVALEDDSRGGSRYLHNTLNEGEVILVGKITESVPWKSGASNHIFIVGGIGITAFFTHIDVFQKINFNYELHFAVRSSNDIPFKELLEKMGDRVKIYNKAKGERMSIPSILEKRAWNSQVYACGPQRMIDEVIRASKSCGMAPDEVHYEAFQIETSGDPFTAELKKDKRVFEVGSDETLLSVLRNAGLEVDSSCETGNCGTCRVDVCSGNVEHRGSSLGEEDKGVAMLTCVSRGKGHIVIDF